MNMICRCALFPLTCGVVLLIIPFPHGLAQVGLTRYQKMFEYHSIISTGASAGVFETRSSALIVDSGSVVVPENRYRLSSRSIRVPIVRIRSLDSTSRIPVFWLSGGPGQSNLHSFAYDYFLPRHDHVMVGYRGVDGDVSLDCPEVVEALRQGGDILSPEVLERVNNAFSAAAARLMSNGIDLNGYTPVEVVDDMEETRKLLGYEAIDLVAESFGTRVAYLYALKYPQRVHRMIMVGGNPPGGMVWSARQNDSLLVRYGELWKNDPTARAIYPDLIEAFRVVNRNFPKRWLLFSIHEGTVKASVNAFLFHKETAAKAFDAYCAAAKGDASGLWLFSFVGGWIFPDIVNWGENACKAVSLDFDSTRDYLHELYSPDALIGAPLGAFLWAPAQMGHWSVAPVDSFFRRPQRCEVSTLFLSGSLDFSTPAENVERSFMPNFPNGHSVVLAESGHIMDLWRSQPAATHRLLTSFLESGLIDTSLVRYTPVSFRVTWGFPLLAKLLVGGAIFLLIVIGWVLWILIRRFRRWRSRRVPATQV